MASSAIEVACVVLVTIGIIGVVVAMANPSWEKSNLDTILNPTSAKYKGLWTECQMDSAAKIICKAYTSFFADLEIRIQVGRGFTIAALFCGTVGLSLCIFALSLKKCSNGSVSNANRVRLFGSILAFLGGLSILTGASWYAKEVLDIYFLTRHSAFYRDGELFVLGEALFIAWSAAFLLIVGGMLGFCISCGQSREDDERMPVSYTAAPRISKEYV